MLTRRSLRWLHRGPGMRPVRLRYRRLWLESLEDRAVPAAPSDLWTGSVSNLWSDPGNWVSSNNPNAHHTPTPMEQVALAPGLTGNITIIHDSGNDRVAAIDFSTSIGNPPVKATLDLSGGSLTLDSNGPRTFLSDSVQVSGGILLDGGTLANAIVLPGTLITATAKGGVLDGDIISGGLDLARNDGAIATIQGGLTLDSTVFVGSADGSTTGHLEFAGSQTISTVGGGLIFLGGSTTNSLDAIPQGEVPRPPITLSLGPGVTLQAQNGIIGTRQTDFTLLNQGTLGVTDQLNIQGDYVQTETGALNVTIGADTVSLVTVSGSATLDGTLRVTDNASSDSAVNDTILTAKSLDGRFSTFSGLMVSADERLTPTFTHDSVLLTNTTALTVTPPVFLGPIVTTSGVTQVFPLGSFVDPGVQGPWTVRVHWGDDSLDTVFQVTKQGSLGTLTHTFTTPSPSDRVRVTVSDALGNSDHFSFPVEVIASPPASTAPMIVLPNTPFQLALPSNLANGVPILTWTIDWGDQTMQTVNGDVTTVRHLFAVPLFDTRYTILATAKDADGFLHPMDPIIVDVLSAESGDTVSGSASSGQTAFVATTDVSATLTLARGVVGSATVTLGHYSGDPTSVPIAGLVFVDIQVSANLAALIGATLTVTIDYPTDGTSSVELRYFDKTSQSWEVVAGGSMGEGNGFVTFTFTTSSTPSLADLTDTVFTVTIATPTVQTTTIVQPPLVLAPPVSPSPLESSPTVSDSSPSNSSLSQSATFSSNNNLTLALTLPQNGGLTATRRDVSGGPADPAGATLNGNLLVGRGSTASTSGSVGGGEENTDEDRWTQVWDAFLRELRLNRASSATRPEEGSAPQPAPTSTPESTTGADLSKWEFSPPKIAELPMSMPLTVLEIQSQPEPMSTPAPGWGLAVAFGAGVRELGRIRRPKTRRGGE
jgi:hypothetical protein